MAIILLINILSYMKYLYKNNLIKIILETRVDVKLCKNKNYLS